MNFNTFFEEDYTPKWDYIGTLPEFEAMKTCKHSSKWHGEGSPWEHTKLVVENAISVVNNYGFADLFCTFTKRRAQAFLLAALFHDIAKPLVTVWDDSKEDWSAPNHAELSATLARKILFDYDDIEVRERAISLIRYHMMMHHLLDDESKIEKKLYKIFSIGYEEHSLLCLCDDFGSWCKTENAVEKYIKQRKLYDLQYRKFEDGFSLSDSQHSLGIILKNIYDQPPYRKGIVHVYVLIGLPGSGKTTYAKTNLTELPIVSRDIARVELGFCEPGEKYLGTPKEEESVTEYVNNKMVELAKAGKSFVVDNTHLKQKYRDGIHKLLREYNVKYHYIYVEAPTLEENIRRRADDGFGDKSENIIKNMLMGFEFPLPYEYDTITIIKEK